MRKYLFCLALLVAVLLVAVSCVVTCLHEKYACDSAANGGNFNGAVPCTNSPKAKSDKENAKWYSPGGDLSYSIFGWPNGVTVWALFLTLVVISDQTQQTARAAKAAESAVAVERDSFIQSQRPKIIVRTLYIKDFLGVLSPPKRIERIGPEFHGQFYIANVGGTTAKVKEVLSICTILDSLPGKRPWEGKPGCKVDLSLKPGTSYPYSFAFDLPSTDEDFAAGIPIGGILGSNKSLYVMGWIDYEDTSGVLRTTRFCRRYDTKTGRFWPVENDPDYESQD